MWLLTELITAEVGPVPDQQLTLFHKTQGHLEIRAVVPVRFVPMTGEVGRGPD